MEMIKTSGLMKKFGQTTALNGVDISVKKGEVFGFIGPNGAGKTTTIRILLGLIKATAGSAHIFGQDCWNESVSIHRRIAYVPGDLNLWPNFTGGQIIDFLSNLMGQQDKEKKEKLIQLFDLDPTKKCRTYSKGNKQKIALVTALSSKADLFIFDEPTSGLDPLMEKVFQDCVKELKAEGKTILLSSHILSEVEQLCDRVAIIRQGSIVESGTLDQLRHLVDNRIKILSGDDLSLLTKRADIYDLELKPGEAIFKIAAHQLQGLLADLSTIKIDYIESTPPTLEDLFVSHYKD